MSRGTRKEISKSYAMDSLSDKRWQTFRKILFRETALEAWTGKKRWNNHPYPNTKIERNGYVCTFEDFTRD